MSEFLRTTAFTMDMAGVIVVLVVGIICMVASVRLYGWRWGKK